MSSKNDSTFPSRMVSEVEELVKLLSWLLMIVEQVVEVNPSHQFHSMNSKITAR
jgi:hypothetical protein